MSIVITLDISPNRVLLVLHAVLSLQSIFVITPYFGYGLIASEDGLCLAVGYNKCIYIRFRDQTLPRQQGHGMSSNVTRSDQSASDISGDGGGDGGDGSGGYVHVGGDGGYGSGWRKHREELSLRRKITDKDSIRISEAGRHQDRYMNKNADTTSDVVPDSRERISGVLSNSEVRTLSFY